MAIESSFIPFPSEAVVPPAAYKAYSGELNVVLVVVFATLGSVIGALVNYFLAYFFGRPVVYHFARSRWGHLCLIDEEKVKKAEDFFNRHGVASTFFGRLVPAVRQLISIPAGLARMNLGRFVLFTALGAGFWNAVLVALGYGLASIYPKEQLMLQVGIYSQEIGVFVFVVIAVAVAIMAYRFVKKKDKQLKHFGIIGYPVTKSFSQKYFNEKFKNEKINAFYDLYPLEKIADFRMLVEENDFCGLNVTIPYKQQVIPYLTTLDETAKEIGAVNVIQFIRQGGGVKLKGWNTDAIGFENSLRPLLRDHHRHALILGTGGASKAVAYVLKKLGIVYRFVSRTPSGGQLGYDELTAEVMASHQIIINCTPVGMYPPDACPDIPYDLLTPDHLLYDLIYNPEKTIFLAKGEERGAIIKNGSEMLRGQAVAAWKIWNM